MGDGESVFDHTQLRDFVADLFAGLGVPPSEAREFAGLLVEADLRGVSSHGVVRIPWYVQDLRAGRTQPVLHLSVQRDSGPLVWLDGHDSLGHLVASRAMTTACERARGFGIGATAVRRGSHFGPAALYAEMAVQHQQVGIVLTNGGAVMAPWGGREKLLGNTPLAVGLPAGTEPPVILDSAQTVVAHGKLSYAKARGAATVPEGWALDHDGRPTQNIDAALEGLLVPIGGYKGYGMALVFDAICGLLLQAGVGEEIRTDQHAGPGPGHLFLCLDVAFFGSVQDFQERMDARIRQIRGSAKAPGVEHIYLPGELEYDARRQRLRNGIPLPVALVRELDTQARSVGIRTLSSQKG